jgi:hypothetical protein
LEKFAINSLLSATHTAEMDEKDKKDIIKKVNTSGDDGQDNEDSDMDNKGDSSDDSGDDGNIGDEPSGDVADDTADAEKELQEFSAYEGEMNNLFINPKKNNMFQPGSNDVLDEESKGLWANIQAKRKRGEAPAKPGDEDYPDKKQWNRLTKEGENESNNYMFWQNLKGILDDATEILGMNQQEVDALICDGHQWALEHVITTKDDVEEVYHFIEATLEGNADSEYKEGKVSLDETEHESSNYMFWASLKTIQHAAKELSEMDMQQVDSILDNGHGWALDHIATSADDMEEVYHFLANTLDAYNGDTDGGYEDEYGSVEEINLNESEYKGKKVKLGKPTKGDVKKFKVFVKNKKGKVVKVNFGDPNMEIKRDDPKRRKSFRARHKCAQAKDRTTPKYWSCKLWSTKPVSKIVGENLITNEKMSIFGKNYFKTKIQETFNQDDMNTPAVQPAPVKQPETKPVQPDTKPAQPIQPGRKNKPFLPMPEIETDPKAVTEAKDSYEVYHNTFSSAVQTALAYAESKGYTVNEDEWFNSIATGPKRPKEGDTNRYSLALYKDGVEQRKTLNIQVYGMGNKYELNAYIA